MLMLNQNKKSSPLVWIVMLCITTLFIIGCQEQDSTNTDATSVVSEADSTKLAMEAKIDSLNKKMMDVFRTTGKPDMKTSMYAVQAYEYYAHDYEKDPKAGMYLMKAGEIYENILNDKIRANRRYQSAYLHEEDFKNKPMALFRSANLYVELDDTARAIQLFETFTEKYPEHEFADDAENMIKITRMGMEEFLKQAQQSPEEPS